MSSPRIAPPSPPPTVQRGGSSSKRANQDDHDRRGPATTSHNDDVTGDACPGTAPRRRTRLHAAQTLPTPPRTRDTRTHTSRSPPASSSAAISSTSRSHHRSSSTTASFASQLALPAQAGGLIPSVEIQPFSEASSRHIAAVASSSINPFLTTTSSSSIDHTTTRTSPPPEPSALTLASSPLHPPPPGPLPHHPTSHRLSAPKRATDALGPSRRGARKGSSLAILPTARGTNDSKGAAGGKAAPKWDPKNPFLQGMGLVERGLVTVGRERKGKIEERQTMDYVFRGQKTTFANPFFTGPSSYQHPAASSSASELDPSHPDFSPEANPPPRLLFPVVPGGFSGALAAAAAAAADSDEEMRGSEDDEDDEEETRIVKPRLLFGAPPARSKRPAPQEEEEVDKFVSDDDDEASNALQAGAKTKASSQQQRRSLLDEVAERSAATAAPGVGKRLKF